MIWASERLQIARQTTVESETRSGGRSGSICRVFRPRPGQPPPLLLYAFRVPAGFGRENVSDTRQRFNGPAGVSVENEKKNS